MHKNSTQYQHVVEDQMELVCRYLPDCVLTFVNQAYCRHHEKNREELIGKSFLPSVRPDDRQVVLGFIDSASPKNATLEPLHPFHHDNSFMISPSTPKIYEINAARIHMPQRS